MEPAERLRIKIRSLSAGRGTAPLTHLAASGTGGSPVFSAMYDIIVVI
jgi:hypothetical protein